MVNRKNVASKGLLSGRMMRAQITGSIAPSTRADSCSEAGMPWKNERNTKVL